MTFHVYSWFSCCHIHFTTVDGYWHLVGQKMNDTRVCLFGSYEVINVNGSALPLVLLMLLTDVFFWWLLQVSLCPLKVSQRAFGISDANVLQAGCLCVTQPVVSKHRMTAALSYGRLGIVDWPWTFINVRHYKKTLLCTEMRKCLSWVIVSLCQLRYQF